MGEAVVIKLYPDLISTLKSLSLSSVVLVYHIRRLTSVPLPHMRRRRNPLAAPLMKYSLHLAVILDTKIILYPTFWIAQSACAHTHAPRAHGSVDPAKVDGSEKSLVNGQGTVAVAVAVGDHPPASSFHVYMHEPHGNIEFFGNHVQGARRNGPDRTFNFTFCFK